VLDVVLERVIGILRPLDRGQRRFQILRVQRRQKGIETNGVVGAQPPQFMHALVPGERVRLQVPVPRARIGGGKRQAQSILALPQRMFHFAPRLGSMYQRVAHGAHLANGRVDRPHQLTASKRSGAFDQLPDGIGKLAPEQIGQKRRKYAKAQTQRGDQRPRSNHRLVGDGNRHCDSDEPTRLL